MQLTKETLLHLKPVKYLFEFKTRSIRNITRVLDLIISHLLGIKFDRAHYRRSEINETAKNVEFAKLHTLHDLVPRALLAFIPHVPRALRALVTHVPRALLALVCHVPCPVCTFLPHVHHILHVLLLTTMISNLY